MTETSKPLISIIIVNYNGVNKLPKLIASINDQVYDHLEVIIVDNASIDESLTYLDKHLPNATVIKNQRNIGFAEANNQGVKVANGEYLMILNNDTHFNKHLVGQLYENLKNLKVNAVAPLILFSKLYVEVNISSSRPILISSTIKQNALAIKNVIFPKDVESKWIKGLQFFLIDQNLKIKLPITNPEINQNLELQVKQTNMINTTVSVNNHFKQALNKVEENIFVNLTANYIKQNSKQIINSKGLKIENKTCKTYDISFGETFQSQENITEVSGLSGCCFMIKKTSLVDSNIFNPSYFAYYEDTDFFLSLNKRLGNKNLVCQALHLFHDVSSSFSQYENEKIYLLERNRLLTAKKHLPLLNWIKEWLIFYSHTLYMNFGGNQDYGIHRKQIHNKVCIDLLKNRTITNLSSIFA